MGPLSFVVVVLAIVFLVRTLILWDLWPPARYGFVRRASGSSSLFLHCSSCGASRTLIGFGASESSSKSRLVESTWRRSRGDVATIAAASEVLRLGRPPFFVCVSQAIPQLQNAYSAYVHMHIQLHVG